MADAGENPVFPATSCTSRTTRDWTDAAGVRHAPARGAFRIVSLVPSLTELLCDLGLAPHLVGRTGFCVHPRATVRAIPKVGGTKSVNLARLRELAPTHVIVNIDENEKPTVEEIARFVPHVVVTHPLHPRDNLALYGLLGGIFRRDAAAGALARQLRAGMARDRARRSQLPARERALSHLEEAVDDRRAQHLHLGHPGRGRLGYRPGSGGRALSGDRAAGPVRRRTCAACCCRASPTGSGNATPPRSNAPRRRT